jgi:hypothetical protein
MAPLLQTNTRRSLPTSLRLQHFPKERYYYLVVRVEFSIPGARFDEEEAVPFSCKRLKTAELFSETMVGLLAGRLILDF